MWIVVAISCSDCNSMAVASFDHRPSEDEVNAVSKTIGGMYCITEYIFESQLNGESVEKELHP